MSTAWASVCHRTVPARLGTLLWEGWWAAGRGHPVPSGSFGHDMAMLGCQDRLGLTGCHSRLPEALRKHSCLEFCWEAQESEGCSMRRLPGSHGRAGRGLWALVLLPMVEGLVWESGSSQTLGLQSLPQCCSSGPGSSGSEPLVREQPESILAGVVLGQAPLPAWLRAVPIPTARANGTLRSSWASLAGQILQHKQLPPSKTP